MKRSKIIFGVIIALVFGLIDSRTAFAQTETLGIIQYTPLEGWKKSTKENEIVFSRINPKTAAYGMVALSGAALSSETPQEYFTKYWNRLAVGGFKAEANPKTETKVTDGWTAISGRATMDSQGRKVTVMLTTYSGFGQAAQVFGLFYETEFLAPALEFVAGIVIDKATVAAVPAPAPAVVPSGAKGKFGAMTYASPPKWSEERYSDRVVFKPTDLPADELLAIHILPPLNLAGGLEQALQRSYEEVVALNRVTMMNLAGGANYQKTDPQKSYHGWEYIRGTGGVQAENGTPYKTELALEVFVAKVNDRFERVFILEKRKNCNYSRYSSSDRTIYRNNIESLLFSLQFDDFKEAGLPPGSVNGDGIVGVWQGISMSVGTPSVGEPLGVRYKVFTPIFSTNGQAYFGPKFPSEGLDGLDTRILAELRRRDWGTYTFSDGKGILKMPYGDIPLRMEDGKLIITPNKTDHRFGKLKPVDGATFDGTYALSELNGKLPTITFTRDGKFTDNGGLKVLSHDPVECVNPALKPGSGRYETKDFSVRFTYTDGRVVRIAFLGVNYDKSNPSPATLMMSFNEDTLIRQ